MSDHFKWAQDRVLWLIRKIETAEPFKADDYEKELNDTLDTFGMTWKYEQPGDRIVVVPKGS